jgi:uncharacterized protein YjlB
VNTPDDEPQVREVRLNDDGSFPNSRLPLLFYPGGARDLDAAGIERLFRSHGWSGAWRAGIYPYHHYHSTTHEVLGVYRGAARVRFGGEKGETVEVKEGDVVVIPAGVAHKRLDSGGGLGVVGAYPGGAGWDLLYGRPDERPEADRNIEGVPIPDADPVFGASGPLVRIWTEVGPS